MGSFLEFNLKSNCPSSFHQKQETQMGVFRHDGMWKPKTQYSENDSNIVHCRILVIYPHDHVADWQLWLTATAQCHESIIPHVGIPRKRSKFKVQFLMNVYHFPTIVKSKNYKWNHYKSGLSVYISYNMHFHGTQISQKYIFKKFFPYDIYLFPRFCYKHLSFKYSPYMSLSAHGCFSL